MLCLTAQRESVSKSWMRTLTEVRELLVVVGQRCRRAKVLAIKRDEEERHCGHLEGLEEDGRVPEQSLGGPDGVGVMEAGRAGR